MRGIKIIPGEEVVTQHRMLVSDMKWKFTKRKKAFAPKLRTWKLKNQDVVHKFQDKLANLLESDANLILESVEDKWRHLMTNLLKATDVSCGLSKKMENVVSRHGGGIVQLMMQ